MKRFFRTVLFTLLFILIFISSFAVYYISAKVPSERKSLSTEKSSIKKEASLHPKDLAVTFLLKAEKDKLILYKLQSNINPVILEQYDVDIALLPEDDRNSLSKGILIDTYADAIQLIEDFSS